MPVLLGTEGADTKNGSTEADTFILLGGNDLAFGGGGSDLMNGGSGNDTMFGGEGNDVLLGSFGVDHMFGGAGADNFRFFDVSESGVGPGNRDIIEDFQVGLDTIDLRSVDADVTRFGNQTFAFIGGEAFHHVPGELRAAIDVTGSLVLRMDVNGDGFSDMNIQVEGTFSVSANDMVL